MSAMAPHSVDLIDKDNAGRRLLALFKHVAHTRRSHADEHLHEVGSANTEERHVRFPGDCASQKRFSCSQRSNHQNSFGNPPSKLRKLLGIFEEVYDLLDLFLRLFYTRHVPEGHAVTVAGQHPSLAFSKI